MWHYFESDDAPERAFLTDYEVFEGGDQVTIYVGVSNSAPHLTTPIDHRFTGLGTARLRNGAGPCRVA